MGQCDMPLGLSAVVFLLTLCCVRGTAADCANFSAPPDSPTNSSITVLSSVSTLNNNNYTVLAVDFGDDNEAYDVIYNSSAPHKLYHSYLESDVYILTILAYNDDGSCNRTFTATIIIQEVITGMNVSSDPFYYVKEVSNLTVTLSSGSNVTYWITWGDGTNDTAVDPNANGTIPFSTGHTYLTEGQYLINVYAFNLVSFATSVNRTNVTAVTRIRNLTLTGNDSLLWSPGYGTWRVALGLNQLQLWNTVCKWTIAGTTFNRSIPLLTADTSHEVNFTFARTDCGVQIVAVNCSNAASWEAMNLTVQLVLDNVTLGSLATHPLPTETLYWNSTITLSLNIVHFGTGSCFEWNMGDGTSIMVFLNPSRVCTGYPIQANPLYMDMTPPYDSINITYNYAQIGNYTITVRGFNHINNDTVVANVTVNDWPCAKPNVTLDSIYSSPSAPYTTVVAKGFNISSNVTVDCLKGQEYTTTWELFNSSRFPGSPLKVVNNTGTYVSLPFVLQYGSYTMRLTVAITSNCFNMSRYVTVVYANITVIQSNLTAGIANGPNQTIPFNSTVTLDSFNATFDPDISDPTNKTGFSWTWLCKRVSETWPVSPSPVPYRRFNTTTSSKSGCFGDGPGILPFNGPLVVLDTTYFQEDVDYVFQLRVTKDRRNASAEMVLSVTYTAAPVLEITCMSNCMPRAFAKDALILRSRCNDNCYNTAGPLTLWWELYKGGTDPTAPYNLQYNLASLTSSGQVTSSSLFVKPWVFQQGYYYRLVINGQVPYSYNGSTAHEFLVNIPPYGGTCSVSPTNGTAADTGFEISCQGWKYMNGLTTDMKYSYLMAPSDTNGTAQGQIFYYGSSPSSESVPLSAGNDLHYYYNDITPVIFDALNDSVEAVVIKVQVMPYKATSTNLVEELSNPSALQSILTGTPAAQTATILSVMSVLNGPADSSGDIDLGDSTSAGDTSSTSGGPDAIPPVKADSAEALAPLPIPSSQEQQAEAQLRETMLSALSAFPIDSAAAITQSSNAVQALMTKPKLVSANGVELAGKIMDSMLTAFDHLQQNQTQEEQIKCGQDVAGVLVSMAISSNSIASDSTSASEAGGSPSSATQSPSAANATANKEMVASTMKRAVNAIERMLDFFEKNMELDDAPLVIYVPKKINIDMDELTPAELKNATFANSFGNIHINRFDTNASCLQRRVIQSVSNLFMWDESALAVNSPISSVTLVPCEAHANASTTSRRSRRSASDQGSATPSSIEADVEVSTPLQRGTYFNETTKDVYGMLIHSYNLTSPGVIPVLLSVSPIRGRNDTLVVYVKGDRKPTPEDYDWILFTYKGTSNYSLYIDGARMRNMSTINVGVQSSEGCRNTTTVCTKMVSIQLNYYISFQDVSCNVWLEDQQKWISGPCQVTSVSPRKVAFHSNLLGGFGGGFVTPVNQIDFNTLFNNFGQKLLTNPCVWATLVSVVVLYVILAVIARRLDQRDLLKWDILPLMDNYDEDEFEYEIHVHTGFARKSGTKSRVFFRIYGSETGTGIRSMSDGIRQNFGRGEVSAFALKTPDSLGVPLKFEVWHDNSGGVNAAWYLGKIVVVDVKTGQWYMFMCDRWLAVDRDDNRIRRILTVSLAIAAVETASLVRKNLSQRIFEDHLWLSVGYRAKRSLFTRAQRLGACMATLFLAMITNCMFYKNADDEAPTTQAIHIGPISITGTQMYNSIISSLIVFPPILVITIIFSKARHNFTGSKYRTKTVHSRMSLGAGTLPPWSVYFAWTLVALCVAVSGVFTVFYSISWGKQKSENWLLAFLLSFAESAILIQPVKVVVVAMLASFVWKQDPDVSEYEDQLGKMKTICYSDREKIHLVGADVALEGMLTSDEIASARRKRELDEKMRIMIREILFYVLFLFFILLVVNGQQDNWSFQQNQNLVYTLTSPVLNNVTYVQQGMWFWALHTLLPVLYPSTKYNEEPVTAYDKNYLSDMNSWRIGPPRLRQLRVRNDRCVNQAKAVRGYRCTNSYSSSVEETSPYEPGWIPVQNLSLMMSHKTDLTDLQKAFLYRTEEDLSGQSFEGSLSSYPGGGYVASLGVTLDSATRMVNNLHRTRWIDIYTRAVFVEFNVLNPGSSLANLVTVLFEFPTIGETVWTPRVEIVQLYRYTGANGVVALVSEIMCAIFVVIVTIMEMRKVCRERLTYFGSFWNWSQLVTLVFFYVAVVLYTLRCIWTTRVVDKMMNNPGEMVSFSPIIRYNNNYLILMGFVAFLTQCQLLHLLRYNQTISVLGMTLAKSASSMFSFAVLGSIVFMAFNIGAYLLFFQLKDYSSLYTCSLSLVAAFLGKFDFSQLVAYYGSGAGYYLLIYLLTMIIFVTNILVALIDDFLAAVANDPSSHPKDHQVVDHFFQSIKALVNGSQKPETRGKKEKVATNNVHALSSRIGYLGDFVETMVQSSWTLEKTDSVLLFVLMYQKEKVKRAPKMKL